MMDGRRPSVVGIAKTLLARAEAAEARVRELEQENAYQREMLVAMAEPSIKHMLLENGRLDMGIAGPAVQQIGLMLSEWFRESKATNYVEMTFSAKTPPHEKYVWTIQRCEGLTPHEARKAAEGRVEELEKAAKAACFHYWNCNGECGALPKAMADLAGAGQYSDPSVDDEITPAHAAGIKPETVE